MLRVERKRGAWTEERLEYYMSEGSSKGRAKGIVEEDPRRAKRESIFILRGETILRQYLNWCVIFHSITRPRLHANDLKGLLFKWILFLL